MRVIILDRKLEKVVLDYRKLQKAYGKRTAKRILLRLSSLMAAESLDDLRNLPGRFHPLTGDRDGQWACDLEHPYHLIFRPVIEEDGDSEPIKIEIIIEVIEIIDYH